MMEKDDLSEDILAWLNSEMIEATARYVKRGRPFANLSLAKLTAKWAETFNDAGAFMSDRAVRDLNSDCYAEFALRQIEPPWRMVEKDWRKIQKAMTRDMKRMSKEALADLGAEVADDLEDFKRRRDQPKN